MISEKQAEFSAQEQANQVAEQMQLAVIEQHGNLAQNSLYLLILLMAVFIFCASLAESDVCAEASGRLEPRTKIQMIMPVADGSIDRYEVEEGQKVKKGDLLVKLNTVHADSELKMKLHEREILSNELAAHEDAKAGLARMIANPKYRERQSLALPEAERIAGELFAAKRSLDSASYDMSTQPQQSNEGLTPEMEVLSRQQERLTSVRDARKQSVLRKESERAAESKKLEAKVSMLATTLEKARTELKELESSLTDAKREMQIYERGKELGVASEVKYLQIKDYMYQREYSVDQQRLQIAELEQDLASALVDLDSTGKAFNADLADLAAGVKAGDAEMSTVPLSRNNTVRSLLSKQANFDVASFHARARFGKEITEISNLHRKLSECEAAIIMLQEKLSERYIRAPYDGVVANFVRLMPGEMVLRGQPLMTVVPADKELVLRGEINNTDVGFIQLGQEARLRFDAFPCEEFGIVKGKVVRVDDYPEEKTVKEKKVSVYRITIQPLCQVIKSADKTFDLLPGLQAHADIVLRKRTLLTLLFEPLLKSEH